MQIQRFNKSCEFRLIQALPFNSQYRKLLYQSMIIRFGLINRPCHFIVLLIFLLYQCSCTISKVSTYNPFNKKALNSTSLTSAGTHFASILFVKGGPKKITVEKVNVTSKSFYSTTSLNFTSSNFNETFKLQTAEDSSQYLVYSTTKLTVYAQNLTLISSPYNASTGATIVDCFYYENTSRIIVVEKGVISYSVVLIYVGGNKKITLNVSNSVNYVKASIAVDSFYLLFLSKYVHVLINTTNENISEYNAMYFPSGVNTSSIDTYLYILAFSYSNQLFVMDTSNNSNIFTYTQNQTIMQVSMVIPYVIIMTSTGFKQLDIDIGVFINNATNTNTNLSHRTVNQVYFAVFPPFPGSTTQIDIFQVTPSYLSSRNTTCLESYYFQWPYYCIKNYTFSLPTYPWYRAANYSAGLMFIPNNYNTTNTTNATNATNATNVTNTTNTTAPVNSTNSTVAAQNSTAALNTTTTNTSNASVNTSAINGSSPALNSSSNPISPLSPTPPAIDPAPSTNSSIGQSFAKSASQIMGKVFIFSSIKATPNFIISLTVLLDDLWYYQYHRCKYPSSVQFYLNKVDIINNLRLSPWFLNFVDTIQQNNICADQSNRSFYEYSADFPSDWKSPDSLYFLNASQDIYKSDLILNIMMFIAIKLIMLALRIIKDRFRFIRSCYLYCKASTKWWSLPIGIIESNITKISFSSAIQILTNGLFTFLDRVNFLAMVLLFCATLCHILITYPLIYLTQKQRPASTILVRSYYSFKSFYLESNCALLRNFSRCFVHGIFLFCYSSQILSLAIIDLIFLLATFLFIPQFLNKTVAVLFIFYQTLILAIDIFFLTHDRFPHIYNEQKYDQILFVVLSVAFVTSILISLVILIVSICDIFQKHAAPWKTSKDQKVIKMINQKPDTRKVIIGKFSHKNDSTGFSIPVEECSKIQKKASSTRHLMKVLALPGNPVGLHGPQGLKKKGIRRKSTDSFSLPENGNRNTIKINKIKKQMQKQSFLCNLVMKQSSQTYARFKEIQKFTLQTQA